MNMSVIWLIAIVVTLFAEAMSVQLTSIWFSVGALAALICALTGLPIWVQLVVFTAVSMLMVFMTRPLVRKYIRPQIQKTNADALVGQSAIVMKDYDGEADMGLVKVNGQTWSAKPKDRENVFHEGDTVRIADIEGVKLVVEKEEKEKGDK